MPIAGGMTLLQTQLQQALSMDKGAQTSLTGTLFGSAVASIVPMGLFPPVPPTPLIPAGVSAGISLIQQALSLDKGAQISTVSQMIASGISMIAPTAPPAGLSSLKSQIESALSMDKGAQISTVSQMIAQAIVLYYLSGGVV
jgi:hypothetical protein